MRNHKKYLKRFIFYQCDATKYMCQFKLKLTLNDQKMHSEPTARKAPLARDVLKTGVDEIQEISCSLLDVFKASGNRPPTQFQTTAYKQQFLLLRVLKSQVKELNIELTTFLQIVNIL